MISSIRAVKGGREGPAPQTTLGALRSWVRERAPGTMSNSCVRQQSEPTLQVPIQPCAAPDMGVGATRGVDTGSHAGCGRRSHTGRGHGSHTVRGHREPHWTWVLRDKQDVDAGATRDVDVGAARDMDAGATRDVDVGAAWDMDTGATRGVDVGAMWDMDTGATRDVDVGATWDMDAGATRDVDVGAMWDMDAGAMRDVDVGAPWDMDAGATRTWMWEPCGTWMREPRGTWMWEPCGTWTWEPRGTWMLGDKQDVDSKSHAGHGHGSRMGHGYGSHVGRGRRSHTGCGCWEPRSPKGAHVEGSSATTDMQGKAAPRRVQATMSPGAVGHHPRCSSHRQSQGCLVGTLSGTLGVRVQVSTG